MSKYLFQEEALVFRGGFALLGKLWKIHLLMVSQVLWIGRITDWINGHHAKFSSGPACRPTLDLLHVHLPSPEGAEKERERRSLISSAHPRVHSPLSNSRISENMRWKGSQPVRNRQIGILFVSECRIMKVVADLVSSPLLVQSLAKSRVGMLLANNAFPAPFYRG